MKTGHKARGLRRGVGRVEGHKGQSQRYEEVSGGRGKENKDRMEKQKQRHHSACKNKRKTSTCSYENWNQHADEPTRAKKQNNQPEQRSQQPTRTKIRQNRTKVECFWYNGPFMWVLMSKTEITEVKRAANSLLSTELKQWQLILVL